jgi:hypothetical protein
VIASAAFAEKINTKEIGMDLMEITEKERLSRAAPGGCWQFLLRASTARFFSLVCPCPFALGG